MQQYADEKMYSINEDVYKRQPMCLAYQIGSKTPSEIARSWQGKGK